jgi:hypothetical protein
MSGFDMLFIWTETALNLNHGDMMAESAARN